jgi:lipoprotein-releasing system permease protein
MKFLPLEIAIRFIKKSKLQSIFISFGLMVGIGVQMFVGLLIDSLQKDLVDKTVGNTPHIYVNDLKNADLDETHLHEIIDDIEANDISAKNVRTGNSIQLASENVNYFGFLTLLDFERDDIFSIKSKLNKGEMISGANTEVSMQGEEDIAATAIMVNQDLADSLSLEVGQELNITTRNQKSKLVKIVGIYDSNIPLLADISLASFFDTDSFEILIQVKNPLNVGDAKSEIQQSLSEYDVDVEDWTDKNPDLSSALNGQKISGLMIQVFVMVSVVIAIASVLSITAVQKSRQIGILKAMGLSDSRAAQVFILQSFIFGFISSLIGTVLGLGLFFGFVELTRESDGSALVEPYIRWNMVIITSIIAVLASIFAGIMPALKTRRLDPIDIINE